MKSLVHWGRTGLVWLALLGAPLAMMWSAGVFAEAPAKAPAKVVQQAGTVNINSASAEELAAGLVGVGPAKAQAIVSYREANGPFTDKSQLLLVKGIGEAILKQNEDRISL
ncbi:MAG: ComEA family DNA-binding protein [Pseudomonadota bacterium]|jgi:competence protein ComEA